MSGRQLAVALIVFASSCAGVQHPPTVARSTTEDQFFAGQVDAAAVSAMRELSRTRPDSVDADRALFILDFTNNIIPADASGELADFIKARRRVLSAATPAEAYQELDQLLQRIASAQLAPSFRTGLIRLATGLLMFGALQPNDPPRYAQTLSQLISQLDAALAAFPESAVRWRLYTEIQLIYARTLQDEAVAAEPRTRLRLVAIENAARQHDAPWLEASAIRLQGNTAIAEYAPDEAPALYAAARKLLVRLERFDLAAETCADELRVLSQNGDPSKATTVADCLGITKKIPNAVVRIRAESTLLIATGMAVMSFVGFRQLQTPSFHSYNVTRRPQLSPLEISLSRQAVDIGTRLLQDSQARGESPQQQLVVRAWLALLLSYLGRHQEVVDALSPILTDTAINAQMVSMFSDAVIAYASSLEELGRFEDSARASSSVAQTMCAPTYPQRGNGPHLYFLAARTWMHAAKAPPAPTLPSVASATTQTRPLLEHARAALRSAIACESRPSLHVLFFSIAVSLALGDTASAAAHGKQYIKRWTTSDRFQRELPSRLELLEGLVAVLPNDADLKMELEKRRERIRRRLPDLTAATAAAPAAP
jgi:hypothetical protein